MHTVVESVETGEFYVATCGGYMLTTDWYNDGGRVEKADYIGDFTVLGKFTNAQIEEQF